MKRNENVFNLLVVFFIYVSLFGSRSKIQNSRKQKVHLCFVWPFKSLKCINSFMYSIFNLIFIFFLTEMNQNVNHFEFQIVEIELKASLKACKFTK